MSDAATPFTDSAPTAAPERSIEPFTPAVKACRDILVDDVDRHLGVPILGDPAPITSIGPDDVAAARRRLATAIGAIERDPVPAGPHVQACRTHLDAAARLLGAPAATASATTVTPRQLRLARRRVAAAIEHLTIVMFAQPEPPPMTIAGSDTGRVR